MLHVEVAGVPVAYVPYFWSPDPTVKRKTGFLAPSGDGAAYGRPVGTFVDGTLVATREVPEPHALAFLGLGLLGVSVARKRQRQR